MKIEYCFPIHKYMSGILEIPDDLLEGKSEDEKWNIYIAKICERFRPELSPRGYYILEDEIEICDSI